MTVERWLITSQTERKRRRMVIRGAVQGVGFRPFVYRLAKELSLKGFVNNSAEGLVIEIEGTEAGVSEFVERLFDDRPALATIHSCEQIELDEVGDSSFEIRKSTDGKKEVLIQPDLATCPDCLREIMDPKDRRYRYPFTNCTNCGPRFSIVRSLPYDRENTTMSEFPLCRECREEFLDPPNRRFHAQPTACSACGPHISLWNHRGEVMCERDSALVSAVRHLFDGDILAIKGLGGFHLCVSAVDSKAVNRLRLKKGRREKPFALMFPSVDSVRQYCRVSREEERLLTSPQAPIVLLRIEGAAGEGLSRYIAPGNPYLGIMLPYTPLHHLLLHELDSPIVATSGNLSEEPICIEESEVLSRLGSIADCFLVHNRRIARHLDDSIVRLVCGRELIIRRARGYVPLPIQTDNEVPPIIAVGGHLKNTVAISVDSNIMPSQHIGDLETELAFSAFKTAVRDLQELYGREAVACACDSHPDYLSTRFAEGQSLPLIKVQHHYAHILACMEENELTAPVLGVSWDGTGFGLDGKIWGGEFLEVTSEGFSRTGHLAEFALPGGESAVKEPRRSALGLLSEAFGDEAFGFVELPTIQAFSDRELGTLKRMIHRSINCPRTSSMGRLFDAVASILGIRQINEFEGQAGTGLEFAATGMKAEGVYNYDLVETGHTCVIDWKPMLFELVDGFRRGDSIRLASTRFHRTLCQIILDLAVRSGHSRVVLSGGCFQNVVLLEGTVGLLKDAGLKPYWHQRIPPNDGGLAVGQIVAAIRAIQKEKAHVFGGTREDSVD